VLDAVSYADMKGNVIMNGRGLYGLHLGVYTLLRLLSYLNALLLCTHCRLCLLIFTSAWAS